MSLPPAHPYPELAGYDADTDTLRYVSPLQRAIQGPVHRPARYPVLAYAMTIHHPPADNVALEGRWVLAVDAANRVCAWVTVIYGNGQVSVRDLYAGPSARLAVQKLDEDRSRGEWANAFTAKAECTRPEPTDPRDAFARLRRMRAYLRSRTRP